MTYISTKTKDSHLQTRVTQKIHQSRAQQSAAQVQPFPYLSHQGLTLLGCLNTPLEKGMCKEMAHTHPWDASFVFLASALALLGQVNLSAKNKWLNPEVQWTNHTPEEHKHFCKDNTCGRCGKRGEKASCPACIGVKQVVGLLEHAKAHWSCRDKANKRWLLFHYCCCVTTENAAGSSSNCWLDAGGFSSTVSVSN